MRERKKPITVYLSEEDLQQLADISRETGMSISSIVRGFLKGWLKKYARSEEGEVGDERRAEGTSA